MRQESRDRRRREEDPGTDHRGHDQHRRVERPELAREEVARIAAVGASLGNHRRRHGRGCSTARGRREAEPEDNVRTGIGRLEAAQSAWNYAVSVGRGAYTDLMAAGAEDRG